MVIVLVCHNLIVTLLHDAVAEIIVAKSLIGAAVTAMADARVLIIMIKDIFLFQFFVFLSSVATSRKLFTL
jgi:hypothetical protein